MKALFCLTLTFLSFQLIAQDAKTAEDLFVAGNFTDALAEYEDLLEEDPGNIEFNYNIGICYLNTYIDKSAAVGHLEKVVASPKFDPNAIYLLGRAYHFAYEFDKAIASYQRFKDGAKGSDFNLADVDLQIQHCEFAKELIKFPVDITFKNLGAGVNSAYSDYFPFVPSDESFVIFNSKRNDGSTEKPDGSFYSDIFMSIADDGEFKKAVKLGDHINSPDLNEEIIGLSANGEKALLLLDTELGSLDLYITTIYNRKLDKPQELEKVINSKYTEIAASVASDGKVIYFASNRPGGYGGIDLYTSRRLPNGKWSPAQNMGPTINTPYDEDFPNISPDNKTLYFSSKGHSSMGGYDIFAAEWDGDKMKFTGVHNLGYPINTPEDNMNFRVSGDGRYGYISALREGGYGELDIYEITFNQVEPKYTVIRGQLKSTSESATIDDPYISVIDLETNEEYGTYQPNPNTMSYVIILPAGSYNLYIESPGFEEYTEDIQILKKNAYQAFMRKDIVLTPQ